MLIRWGSYDNGFEIVLKVGFFVVVFIEKKNLWLCDVNCLCKSNFNYEG